jgi:hypothetical protein
MSPLHATVTHASPLPPAALAHPPSSRHWCSAVTHKDLSQPPTLHVYSEPVHPPAGAIVAGPRAHAVPAVACAAAPKMCAAARRGRGVRQCSCPFGAFASPRGSDLTALRMPCCGAVWLAPSKRHPHLPSEMPHFSPPPSSLVHGPETGKRCPVSARAVLSSHTSFSKSCPILARAGAPPLQHLFCVLTRRCAKPNTTLPSCGCCLAWPRESRAALMRAAALRPRFQEGHVPSIWIASRGLGGTLRLPSLHAFTSIKPRLRAAALRARS